MSKAALPLEARAIRNWDANRCGTIPLSTVLRAVTGVIPLYNNPAAAAETDRTGDSSRLQFPHLQNVDNRTSAKWCLERMAHRFSTQ